MSHQKSHQDAIIAALQWHVDENIDCFWNDTPQNKCIDLGAPANIPSPGVVDSSPAESDTATADALPSSSVDRGTSALRQEAAERANAASTLEELETAIREFDGISIKNTATNLVFSDGNPAAKIMIVGDIPETDEDRAGKPFAGECGHLLDKMFACIGLSRKSEKAESALYLSNILNWRPPGNRSPTSAEIEMSLPFIRRHITLIKPQILILAGGVSAKSLLNKTEGISKLRGKWHSYTFSETTENEELGKVSAIPMYHPSYLLRNPAQKKAAWNDLIMVKSKYK